MYGVPYSVVAGESVEFVFDGVAQDLLHGRAVFGGGDFEAVLQTDGQAQGEHDQWLAGVVLSGGLFCLRPVGRGLCRRARVWAVVW